MLEICPNWRDIADRKELTNSDKLFDRRQATSSNGARSPRGDRAIASKFGNWPLSALRAGPIAAHWFKAKASDDKNGLERRSTGVEN